MSLRATAGAIAWGKGSAVDGSGIAHHGLGFERRAMMTGQDQKLRLAVAVLEGGGRIRAAIRALIEKGIARENIGIVALASTVSALSSGLSSSDVVSCVIASATALSPLAADGAVVASPSLLRLWRTGVRLPALWDNYAGLENVPRLASDMETRVAKGGAIIAVAPVDSEQQWDAMRVLLEFSTTPVQMLELARPV